jgi:hypothetical protein
LHPNLNHLQCLLHQELVLAQALALVLDFLELVLAQALALVLAQALALVLVPQA